MFQECYEEGTNDEKILKVLKKAMNIFPRNYTL